MMSFKLRKRCELFSQVAREIERSREQNLPSDDDVRGSHDFSPGFCTKIEELWDSGKSSEKGAAKKSNDSTQRFSVRVAVVFLAAVIFLMAINVFTSVSVKPVLTLEYSIDPRNSKDIVIYGSIDSNKNYNEFLRLDKKEIKAEHNYILDVPDGFAQSEDCVDGYYAFEKNEDLICFTYGPVSTQTVSMSDVSAKEIKRIRLDDTDMLYVYQNGDPSNKWCYLVWIDDYYLCSITLFGDFELSDLFDMYHRVRRV